MGTTLPRYDSVAIACDVSLLSGRSPGWELVPRDSLGLSQQSEPRARRERTLCQTDRGKKILSLTHAWCMSMVLQWSQSLQLITDSVTCKRMKNTLFC